jgi:hypothetical protein
MIIRVSQVQKITHLTVKVHFVGKFFKYISALWIRIGFNADSDRDLAFQVKDADPDPISDPDLDSGI